MRPRVLGTCDSGGWKEMPHARVSPHAGTGSARGIGGHNDIFFRNQDTSMQRVATFLANLESSHG